MGFDVLQIVDVVAGFLLAAAGGLMLWYPHGWPLWPRRLRDDPAAQSRAGVVPLIFGTFIATLELLVMTGNSRAIDYVVFPITGLVATAALTTVWMRWRVARRSAAEQTLPLPQDPERQSM
jgi:hypothetical protein